MKESTAANVIRSRLLVLQSKRLVLSGAIDQFNQHASESRRARIERMHEEAERAQHEYRNAVLAYGSPGSTDYWLVAYGRLIETGTVLSDRLRSTMNELSPAERFEVAADVEMLESLIGRWNEAKRLAMAESIG